MSEPQTTTAEILVHLVRPGSESQEVHLAEGSTVADLLRASGVSATNPAILIDGVPIEQAVTLADPGSRRLPRSRMRKSGENIVKSSKPTGANQLKISTKKRRSRASDYPGY